MNGLEIYNDILANTHNLKGTWEVTAENYLNVTGNTNGSIVLFDKTVGALGDFILEWTAEQKGGSYIHSNLCPSLRYTPEDAGIEGGGDNYAMLVYLCNYGGNPGTFNLRTEGGTKSEINTSGVSLNIDTVYTFKLERLNGMYRLYQDGVLINEATDITKKKLYLGWYLWYGGTNSDYQTNFILREYNLTKIDTKSYLDTIGLTSLWSKIKSLFATKTELASKANTSDLSTVATSGSYNDLTNKPTIPTVNNATLTIQKNGTTVKTFTANASANVTANITVPTKVSDLTNDSGFLTTHQDISGKADKATTLSGYGITDAYTKTQVDKKVSDLVNSAPETLDTLNELASALGNDPNFATTVATQIGTKANDSEVVHKSGDETIAGVKTFSSNIVGNLTGNADTATKATQDSDGNQISSTYLPLAGGLMTGFFIGRNVDNSFLHLSSCTDHIKGAMLIMYGEGSSDQPGDFRLIARNSSTIYELNGKPNGELFWGGKHIVRSVNGVTADQNGNVYINSVPRSNEIYTANGSYITQNDSGSFYAYDNNRKAFVWNSTDGYAYFYGLADKALQDSDGNQINTTYFKGSSQWYEVGSTIFAITGTPLGYGETTAGSNLKYAALDSGGGIYDLNSSIGATGTWVKVSGNSGNTSGFGLYRRIA